MSFILVSKTKGNRKPSDVALVSADMLRILSIQILMLDDIYVRPWTFYVS